MSAVQLSALLLPDGTAALAECGTSGPDEIEDAQSVLEAAGAEMKPILRQ